MAAELTNITVEYDCPIRASLKDGRLVTILAAFALVLPQILTMFVETVLLAYAQVIMDAPHKPFACARCGNDQKFIWKTQHGKPTKILTVYQWVILRQLQIQCSVCRHKFYLTRPLLGMEPHERIPKEVYRKLGLVGALASYRVGAKIVSTFGWTLDKMTIWKAVQGGQRSLTKRRPKRSYLSSIPTRRPGGRRMARVSAFKASPNAARNSKCSPSISTVGGSGSPGWALARTTGAGRHCFNPAWRPLSNLNSSSWSPMETRVFSTG